MDIVEMLTDDGAQPFGYLAEGHYPSRVFAAALQAEYGYRVDELQRIEHVYFEVVPRFRNEWEWEYKRREKGDARAQPFTVVEC